MSSREKIVIIGGGLSGCLAALFASRVEDEHHQKKYDITLVEANDNLLSGASQIAARLHLGGEYPYDGATGFQCLWGAALLKLVMPKEGIFTQERPMRFLISRQTHQKGRLKVREGLTFQNYVNYYNNVAVEYDMLLGILADRVRLSSTAAEFLGVRREWEEFSLEERNAMRKKLRIKTKLETLDEKKKLNIIKSLIKNEIGKVMFGPAATPPRLVKGKAAEEAAKDPLSHYFYYPMDPKDLAWYGNHAEGGILTHEPGVDIPRYLCGIEQTIKNTDNITVVTGSPVVNVERHGPRYTIRCANGRSYEASQVIQAAWEGGFALDSEFRHATESQPGQHKKPWVYRRAMALVDTHNIPLDDLPFASFVLSHSSGGMFCPLNDDIALVYHPDVAHLEEMQIDTNDPKRRSVQWKNPVDKEAILKKYKELLVNGPFPFLKKAEFKELVIRPTLNFDESNRKEWRRHERTEEVEPGYHAMYSTKATLTPASAIEAVEQLRERSRLKEKGRGKEKLMRLIGTSRVLERALLDPTFHIAELVNLNDKAAFIDFLEKRSLPASMAWWLKKRTPYDLPASYLRNPEVTPDLYPETAVATTKTMSVPERTFGQGFGPHKISVYTESGPKTGVLFAHEGTYAAVRRWVEENGDRPISSAVPGLELADAVQNRLMHADMLELIEWMRDASILSQSSRDALFGQDNLKRLTPDIWSAVKESRDRLPLLKTLRSKANLMDIAAPESIKTEIAAALLPTLFGLLDELDRVNVARQIAEGLHEREKDKEFFAPLADSNLNKLIVRRQGDAPAARHIMNNGRAIQIDCEKDRKRFAIEFQGKTFYPTQFHFHRTRNLKKDANDNIMTDAAGNVLTEASVTSVIRKKDGEFEFKLYRDRAHEQGCARGGNDPNDQAVGELHAIFTSEDKSALALCAHVKLDKKANAELEKYIGVLRGLNQPLEVGKPIPFEGIDFQPLKCFNQGKFTTDEALPEAPFASLSLGGFDVNEQGRVVLKQGSSPTFYRGVHVVHLPDDQSVTISPEQLEVLEKAQPHLLDLSEELFVRPISRAGGKNVMQR